MTILRPLERALTRRRMERRQARRVTDYPRPRAGLHAFVGRGSDTGWRDGVQPTLYGPLTPRPLGGWPLIETDGLARDVVEIRRLVVGADGRSRWTRVKLGCLSHLGPWPEGMTT